MTRSDEAVLQAWERVAPSTLHKIRGIKGLPLNEQRAVVEGCVAWLNSMGAADPVTSELRRRLAELLRELDEGRRGPLDSDVLESWTNDWLETAGQVGGPEQEQDPTRPHPKAWHSHRSGDDR